MMMILVIMIMMMMTQETQETQETHDNDNDDDNNADAGTWDLEAAMLQYAWAATAIIGSY